METIKIKKTHLEIFLILAGLTILSFFYLNTMTGFSISSIMPEKINLQEEYSLVTSSPSTGSCGALGHLQEGDNLKGSCCGKMREDRYVKQRTYLQKYSNIKDIPKDPWNVPVSLARELTNYDKTIQLTSEEQAIFDGAFDIFDEGPCCCKCWRWTTFEGLAKKMIKEQGFTSQQVAELWASEDVCGDEDPFEELEE